MVIIMHRFFVDKDCLSTANKNVIITGEDVNHIKNVLRIKIGEDILVSDGEGTDYRCTVSDIGTDEIIANIVDITKNCAELPVKITLFQGMPKLDKLEFIIQKAVELGVTEIVPVITKRTVVKLDDKKASKKLERYNGIAMAAGKQSGRGIVPCVREFMTFKQALSYAKEMDMAIIPYEEAKGIDYSRQIIKKIKWKSTLGIFIGPEGGFANEELEAALEIGAHAITLGQRILRTETAGLAVLSIIMFELEE